MDMNGNCNRSAVSSSPAAPPASVRSECALSTAHASAARRACHSFERLGGGAELQPVSHLHGMAQSLGSGYLSAQSSGASKSLTRQRPPAYTARNITCCRHRPHLSYLPNPSPPSHTPAKIQSVGTLPRQFEQL